MQAHGGPLIRRLSSAIHPPLPMTPRQTSQLLASLRSSFQRHLDQHHPEPRSSTSAKLSSASSQARDACVAASASLSETTTHFDSIVTHPAFAGIQQPSRQHARAADQPAFKILQAAEEKVKYGKLSVLEAANLFQTMYNLAIVAKPTPRFSYASRFVALLKSSGAHSLIQFFSITGVASRWTRLMFHEQREREILQLMRSTHSNYQLLPHYLSATVRNHGVAPLVKEMKRIDGLVKAGDLALSETCCSKSMFFIMHSLVKLHQQPAQSPNLEMSQAIEEIRDTIFGTIPTQMHQLLAISKLVLDSEAAEMVAFVKSLRINEGELAFWTETQSRRRLLLEASLKAAAVLCEQEEQAHQQDKHADAQYLVHFAEVVFAEELQITDRQSHTPAARKEQQSPKEDAAILSRLDGLLLA